MGVSTDAVLFYGHCWDEENDDVLACGDGWVEKILRGRGVVNPWDSYPDAEYQAIRDYDKRQRAGTLWCAHHRADLDAWHAAMCAVRKEYGCDVGRHGSEAWPLPYLLVVESRLEACRGCPVPVEGLSADPAWDDMLTRFASDLGIALPEPGPRWWLCSWWG